MATIILECEEYTIPVKKVKNEKENNLRQNIQVIIRDMKKKSVGSIVFGKTLWREKVD